MATLRGSVTLGRLAASAVDSVFRETVRFLPLKGGRTDPSREVLLLPGILRVGNKNENNLTGGQADSWAARIADGKAELRFNRQAFPTLRVRLGDKFVAIERVGEPLFEVYDVSDRDVSRLIVYLNEA